MTAPYNASRKADRQDIRAMLTVVAERMGARIEAQDEPRTIGYCGPGTTMRFTLNGVGATISIDDLHGGHEGLLSWYNDYSAPGHRTARHFAPGFNTAVGEYGKQGRPHHKATSSGTWEVLAARLQAGLRKARDGQAFTQEDKAA
jgi:hypothetical protein